MMNSRKKTTRVPRVRWLAPLVAGALLVTATCAAAGDLLPRTKVKLSVVQWIPTKGQYQSWDALGGEFEVGDDGTLLLPVVGAIDVSGRSTAKVADEIAKRIKDRIGLITAPSTTVQIVAYPPIYVVGDVAQPGEFQFHQGQTVLQALAASGGKYRAAAQVPNSAEVVNLVSAIQDGEDQILLSSARVARLKAEMTGASQIDFPSLPTDPAMKQRAKEIFAQERTIFKTRADGLNRQVKSLEDLQKLLVAEIDTLQKKIGMTDDRIASTQKELKGVKTLVKQGIAVTSHQSEVERQLSAYQSDRLDNLTATMRARQQITEAKRNLQRLQDDRMTEVASALQQEQATLDGLKLKRETNQKLLVDALARQPAGAVAAATPISYTLIRKEGGKSVETAATELTQMLPGDVLKVVEAKPVKPGSAGAQTGASVTGSRGGTVPEHGA